LEKSEIMLEQGDTVNRRAGTRTARRARAAASGHAFRVAGTASRKAAA
jgi:hypothetical protein